MLHKQCPSVSIRAKNKKNEKKMKPSIPKGTRDFGPIEMAKRNYIFNTIREVYALYGFQQIETPAMETLRKTSVSIRVHPCLITIPQRWLQRSARKVCATT